MPVFTVRSMYVFFIIFWLQILTTQEERKKKFTQVHMSTFIQDIRVLVNSSVWKGDSDQAYIICSHDTEEDKSWAGERLDSWNKLSQPAKEQFFWPQPGVNYTGLQEASSGE